MIHFLTGTILFSSISPKAEEYLKEELYGCMKHIGIPLSVLDKMPVRDRRAYIFIHNKKTEEENNEINNKDTNVINGEMINKYTDIEQQNIKNMAKR